MSEKGLTEALKSPQAMDDYLEVNSAKEIIEDIRAVMQPERTPRVELWMRVYAGIASSAGGSSEAALRWADRAVEQFDKRFQPVSP